MLDGGDGIKYNTKVVGAVVRERITPTGRARCHENVAKFAQRLQCGSSTRGHVTGQHPFAKFARMRALDLLQHQGIRIPLANKGDDTCQNHAELQYVGFAEQYAVMIDRIRDAVVELLSLSDAAVTLRTTG